MSKPENAYPFPTIANMTLRDYFAAQAIPGIAAKLMDTKKEDALGPFGEVLASFCYQIADAMLRERER